MPTRKDDGSPTNNGQEGAHQSTISKTKSLDPDMEYIGVIY